MNEFPYFTLTEVAAQLGVSGGAVYVWLRKGLIKPSFKKGKRFFFVQSDIDNRIPPNPRGRTISGIREKTLTRIERDQEFIAAYKSGQTLQQIGIQHGITRERVRQRLKASGITRKDGGLNKRVISNSARREKANQERKELRAKRFYGCTLAQLNEARFSIDAHRLGKFNELYWTYRKRAQQEKMPWSVSFPEFVTLMKDYIYDIGRGKKVLMRSDSNKGFEIGNLTIVTHSESSALTRRRKQIIDLYEQGKGPTEIARLVGIARETVASTICQIKNMRKFNRSLYTDKEALCTRSGRKT